VEVELHEFLISALETDAAYVHNKKNYANTEKIFLERLAVRNNSEISAVPEIKTHTSKPRIS
jgi:hypothetical protein